MPLCAARIYRSGTFARPLCGINAYCFQNTLFLQQLQSLFCSKIAVSPGFMCAVCCWYLRRHHLRFCAFIRTQKHGDRRYSPHPADAGRRGMSPVSGKHAARTHPWNTRDFIIGAHSSCGYSGISIVQCNRIDEIPYCVGIHSQSLRCLFCCVHPSRLPMTFFHMRLPIVTQIRLLRP